MQKYGGSSLDSPSRIKAVAEKIADNARRRNRIIVIVSAMGKTTDDLMTLAHEISPHPRRRELDMLLTVGERISMALLSMALNDLGFPAISFTGSQSGILTNMIHTRAVIEEIRAGRIREALEYGKIAIVAGFQGVSRQREITTLGRGGSDTTAVALASIMAASRCEIYSDYPGLFTADPRFIPSARRVASISHDEMLELASLGAKVLHYRAADIARKSRVPVMLLSSFEDTAGTVVQGEAKMENLSIKSVTYNESVGIITAQGGVIESGNESLSRALENSGANLIFYQKTTMNGKTAVICVAAEADFENLESIFRAFGDRSLSIDTNRDTAAVSVVGCGFAHKADAISSVERTLSEAGIPTFFVWNSSLSVSCLVPKSACKEAVAVLHGLFFPKKDGANPNL